MRLYLEFLGSKTYIDLELQMSSTFLDSSRIYTLTSRMCS